MLCCRGFEVKKLRIASEPCKVPVISFLYTGFLAKLVAGIELGKSKSIVSEFKIK
jgi:hypothetical protein